MAKLPRQHQKVFGKDHNLGEVKKYGSLAAAAPANALTPEEVQSLSKFTDGWFSAIIGANSPTIQDRNALDYVFGYQLAYLMETGVPEWNVLTTYYIGGIVNVGGKLYKSLVDNNLNNLVTDGSKWEELVRGEQLIDVPLNIILSGKTRATSNQPQFINPNGAAASFTVEGLATNLEFYANNAKGIIAADIVKAGLTLAPAANNTCLVNDADAASQEETRTWGEEGAIKEYILIDTIGTEISTRVGEWASFKIGTEYFFGLIEADRISKIHRGYFTDLAGNPVNRVTFADNAVITFLSTAWVFANIDGLTVDVTYNNVIWSDIAPAAPTAGDYWFDTTLGIFKEYDGAVYTDSESNLIGLAIIDTANCIGARSFDFFRNFSRENNIKSDLLSVTEIKQSRPSQKISVYGTYVNGGISLQLWDMATNLASAVDMYNGAEQASTTYYLYISDKDEIFISDISPYYRADLFGYYHPHNTWRCVGECYNDAALNLVSATNEPYNGKEEKGIAIIYDVKTLGVHGGTLTSGVWSSRVFNTIEGDSSFVTLTNGTTGIDGTADRYKIKPGRYKISGKIPADNIDGHRARLYDHDNSAVVGDNGPNSLSINTAAPTTTHAFVDKIIDIETETEFSVQHLGFTTQATWGFGRAINLVDDEIFSILVIEKL